MLCKDVAMGARDFADDSVGAEQAQSATDSCTLTP